MVSKRHFTCAGCGLDGFSVKYGGPEDLPLCLGCHRGWIRAGRPDDLDLIRPAARPLRAPDLKPKDRRAPQSRHPTVNLTKPYVWRDPARGWRPEDRTGEAAEEDRPDGPPDKKRDR